MLPLGWKVVAFHLGDVGDTMANRLGHSIISFIMSLEMYRDGLLGSAGLVWPVFSFFL